MSLSVTTLSSFLDTEGISTTGEKAIRGRKPYLLLVRCTSHQDGVTHRVGTSLTQWLVSGEEETRETYVFVASLQCWILSFFFGICITYLLLLIKKDDNTTLEVLYKK